MSVKEWINAENGVDYTDIRQERGKTPEDIKQQCLDLCKDYLAGNWLQLTVDDIEVKRLSGGLTNQLYYCGVSEGKRNTGGKEPQEVTIRLYGSKHFNNLDNNQNERLSDTIISLIISENGVGPQIYGLFEKGQIQKYYHHSIFCSKNQKDPQLVSKVGKTLAKIHAMDVPMKRTGNWIFDYFDDSYKVSNQRFDIKELIERCDLKNSERT